MRNVWLRSVFLLTLAVSLPCLLPAQGTINLTNLTANLIAKAPFDECWIALGQNVKYDYPPCPAGQTPKVNQAYVWSLTEAGNYMWFGTTANTLCTTTGEAAGALNANPYQTVAWACEFGKSPYSPDPYIGSLGDVRPPKIYIYNKSTHVLSDITPTGPISSTNPQGIDPDVVDTVGFRAVSVVGDHVIFGGPSTKGGVNMFAFRVSDGGWVAKDSFRNYVNMRQFVTVNGVAYAGVRTTPTGGSLLRYTGTIPDSIVPPPPNQAPSKCSTCLTFSDVADFDGEAADVVQHNGRIYVGTWPTPYLNRVPGTASIFMSPPIPSGGLTGSNIFTKVFDAAQYEPDPIVLDTYGIGAMREFGNYLYFGTDNPPEVAAANWFRHYGEPRDPAKKQQVFDDTFRSTTIFRISGEQQGTPNIELLYGESQLWVYTPPNSGIGPNGTWALTPNMLPVNKNPAYGSSGLGYPYNAYTWSMTVFNGHLYLGTFDWSYVYLTPPIVTLNGIPSATVTIPPPDPNCGADLFSFADTNSPAVAETTTGVGNYTNYGIRNMIVASDGGSMWLGMSNPMNLLTDANSGYPMGGWELIQVFAK